MELREYERLRNDFIKAHADIVAISPEISDLGSQTKSKNSISYPILRDVDARFMRQIGIVFKLDEASKKEYVNFGMDFTQINGNDRDELPVPAVYVINRKMEIVFKYFEEDYTTRLEPSRLLEAIQNIKN